jgi:GT2 family glycosyltransferase
MKATIIITDFLKAERVVKNIASLKKQIVNFAYEIIVVDNSVDADNAKILQQIDGIELIVNETNLGYPRANNMAAKKASGEFLFFVNPDIVWSEPSTLQTIVNYLEHNDDVGILGPQHISEQTNKSEKSARRFPSLFRQIIQRVTKSDSRDSVYEQTTAVDWLHSSFWAMRRDLFFDLGGFNEHYFLFYADTELCRKCNQRQKQVIYFTDTKVQSDGLRCSSGGIGDFFSKKTVRIHLQDALKYYRKYPRDII